MMETMLHGIYRVVGNTRMNMSLVDDGVKLFVRIVVGIVEPDNTFRVAGTIDLGYDECCELRGALDELVSKLFGVQDNRRVMESIHRAQKETEAAKERGVEDDPEAS